MEPFFVLVEINIILWLTGPEMLHAEETQSLCPANRKVWKDYLIALQRIGVKCKFEILVVTD